MGASDTLLQHVRQRFDETANFVADAALRTEVTSLVAVQFPPADRNRREGSKKSRQVWAAIRAPQPWDSAAANQVVNACPRRAQISCALENFFGTRAVETQRLCRIFPVQLNQSRRILAADTTRIEFVRNHDHYLYYRHSK
jgi:hypothetical protein